MNNIHMLHAMQEMLYYAVVAVCIITVPVLIVGVLISIMQAATQINEMTITFIPKLIVMFSLLFFFGPWLMSRLVMIMQYYMLHLPYYIR